MSRISYLKVYEPNENGTSRVSEVPELNDSDVMPPPLDSVEVRLGKDSRPLHLLGKQ